MDIRVKIKNEEVRIPGVLIEAADGDELVARIFYNRGYRDAETVRQMLHEELYMPASTSEFPGMEAAVCIVREALAAGKKMAVYGDYDVDGVTSTVLLVQALRSFGAQVVYHVPDRFTEGYGMNNSVIEKLGEDGISLIITCDCGISNLQEIETAKGLGMTVLVTDHHNLPPQLPPADVILNPKLLPEGHRARNLSGCAMAYFLVLALLESFEQVQKAEEYLDLVAMSLIADVVSLNGENRYLLKKALPLLFQTQRPGLKALFNVIGKDSKLESEEDVAFQVAPRINAAGRMESARLPVELLLGTDGDNLREMAVKIDFLNKDRKQRQQQIFEEAVEMVESRKKNQTVLVLYNDFWHHGIVGIAAGKICEKYRKPAILLSLKEDGKTVTGSARSVEDVNIYELIQSCSGKLAKFGGHAQAAGLSLLKEDVESFTAEIEKMAESRYHIKDRLEVETDGRLALSEISEELLERLNHAGPYGEGFEPPMFLTQGVTAVSDRKTDKNHHIMVLADEKETRVAAVKWFGPERSLQDQKLDVTYRIQRNTYRGNNQLQLGIDHFIPSSGTPVRAFKGEFVDARNSAGEELRDGKETLYFYEGFHSKCPIEGACDRYHLHPEKNLVFLSAPVNTQVFREVIALVNPEKVVIRFSTVGDYSLKGFLTNLLGLVKHSLAQKGGVMELEQMALRLNVEDGVVVAALKYLQAAGKISFSLEDSWVSFYEGTGRVQGNVKLLEKRLGDALAEKNAYREFVQKLEIERFKEYLR